MFTRQQIALLSSLARQAPGRISFTQTRRLVRPVPSDEDYAATFVLIFVFGILLLLALGIALATRAWPFAAGVSLALAGLGWATRRTYRSRLARPSVPPTFLFDLPERSFYLLAQPHQPGAAGHYERYPAQLLSDARTVVLLDDGEYMEVGVELAFGGKRVCTLQAGSEQLATDLARVILHCKLF